MVYIIGNIFAEVPEENAQRRTLIETLQREVDSLGIEKVPFGTNANLCEKVYQSQDKDLIAQCFNKEASSTEMWFLLLAEKDPALRTRNVLIVLRAKPGSWGEPDDPLGDPGSGLLGARIEFCLPVLKQYLPERTLSKYRLSFPGNRLQIANLLEKALLPPASPMNSPVWWWALPLGIVVIILTGWFVRRFRVRQRSLVI
jgi:hypothetical protein